MLIGRSALLAQIEATLADQTASLVTLVGMGGIGKTRVAQEICARMGEQAVFCDLTATDADNVLIDIGTQVTCASPSATTSRARIEAIAKHVDRPGSLLVLDNVETVIVDGGAQEIAQLADAFEHTRVLCTSREHLMVRDERVVEVGPLDREAGVLLFANRAQAFDIERESHEATLSVSRLVEALDGIPLAIELAASRTNLLSLDELHVRLQHRFALLQTQRSDLPARHRALYGAIEDSWNTLSVAAQSVLAQASVFQASFSFDAAEAVLTTDKPMLDVFDELLRKSMVSADAQLIAQRRRIRVFDTISAFAAEKHRSTASDEARRALDERFADYYLRTVEEASRTGILKDAIRWFSIEYRNLRRAFRLAIATDPTRAVRFAVEASFWFRACGPASVNLQMMNEALRCATDHAPELEVAAHVCAAMAEYDVGDRESAHVTLGRARGLIDGEQSHPQLSVVHAMEATLRLEAGETDVALALAREAVCLATSAGPRAKVLPIAAEIAIRQRRRDEAQALLDELSALSGPAQISAQLAADEVEGLIACDSGQFPRARQRMERAREIAESHGLGRALVRIIANLGLISFALGEFAVARVTLEDAISRFKALGMGVKFATTMADLGCLEIASGNPLRGTERLQNALQLLHPLGDVQLTAQHLGAMAMGVALSGNASRADRLLNQLQMHERDHDLRGATSTFAREIVELIQSPRRRERTQLHSFRGASALRAKVLEQLADSVLLQATSKRAVVVTHDARFFRTASGERVDLARRPTLHRVFRALVEHHMSNEHSLDVDQLFGAAWPDTRAVKRSRKNRVQVAVSTLRRLGLEVAIETTPLGYRLMPDVVRILSRTDDLSDL